MTKREQREAPAILDRLAQVVVNGEMRAPRVCRCLEGAAAALKVTSRAPDRKGQGRRVVKLGAVVAGSALSNGARV